MGGPVWKRIMSPVHGWLMGYGRSGPEKSWTVPSLLSVSNANSNAKTVLNILYEISYIRIV